MPTYVTTAFYRIRSIDPSEFIIDDRINNILEMMQKDPEFKIKSIKDVKISTTYHPDIGTLVAFAIIYDAEKRAKELENVYGDIIG